MVETGRPAKRGIALTIWLGGYTALVAYATVVAVIAAIETVDHGRALELGFALGLGALFIQVFAVAALWTWRRIGVKLLFGALALDILATIVAEGSGGYLAVRIVLAFGLVFMVLPHWERMKE